MVSVGMSLLGITGTELVFIEPGVKINGAYYHEVLLNQHLLPAICSISEHFTLQQDNAVAHRDNETVEFCLAILPITSHRGCGHRTHRT